MASKIIDLDGLVKWREACRDSGRSVILTNGCFDLIHVGHLRSLQHASTFGDELVVAVNGNESVRALKGPSRPICDEADRAELLAGFQCVSKVHIFPDVRLDSVIAALRPDIYLKGGDYTLETLDGSELNSLQDANTQIVFFPIVEGVSTTGMIDRIQTGSSSFRPSK